MSGRCTGWVLRHGPHPDMLDRDGKPYAARARGLRSVLITIADAANADGEHAHPGVPAMMDGSLYSKRQVVALAGELEADGWLTVEERGKGRGHATVYRVNMDRETVQSAHRSDDGNGAVADTERCSPEHEKVQSRESAPPFSNGSNANTDASKVSWHVPDAARANLDAAIALCELFADLLRARGDSPDPHAKSWVLPMEAMIRLDGREPEHIGRVIRWLDRGEHEIAAWWQPNVRSPSKLRAKWTTIAEQTRRAVKGKSKANEVPGGQLSTDELMRRNYGTDAAASPPASSALSLPYAAAKEVSA